MLNIGIKGHTQTLVTPENTASAWGSGNLDVFATPAMIAYMEQTCANSVQPELDEGFSTVGTLVNVKHVKATPLGGKVNVYTELVEIDRKRLVFAVKAEDEAGLIGEGIHERFIINCEKFLSKISL